MMANYLNFDYGNHLQLIFVIMRKRYQKKIEINKMILKGGAKLYIDRLIKVDFESGRKADQSKNGNKQFNNSSVIPTFNIDNKYYTPCFIIPCLQRDDQQYYQKHNNKKENCIQIPFEQLMMPKPKNKDYCHVCHIRFEDYLEHCSSEEHQQMIISDNYHRKIKKLCKKLKKYNLLHDKIQRSHTLEKYLLKTKNSICDEQINSNSESMKQNKMTEFIIKECAINVNINAKEFI